MTRDADPSFLSFKNVGGFGHTCGAVIIISGILFRSSIYFIILLLILEIFICFNLVYQGNRVESKVKLAYESKQWTERILETYPSRPAHSRTCTQNSLPDTNDKDPSLLGTCTIELLTFLPALAHFISWKNFLR